MAPKKKNKGRGRRSKSAGQTSASNPKPTATSPSASIPTGGATTTTQPLPSAPLEPIQETHQECISCTSDSAPTTDLAGPSTAPSASDAPKLLPITNDFMSLFAPALTGALAAVHILKKRGAENLQETVVSLLGFRLDEMESVVGSLQGLAEKMGGEVELKMASEAVENMDVIKSTVEVVEKLLLEKRNRDGTGGSCGGSERKGGGPDSGTGEGDGEGGGVSV